MSPLRVEAPAARRSEPHIPVLDGLRGLAILLVMLHHFASPAGLTDEPAATAIHRLLYPGWCGVDLFFVLSGFLITGILLKAKGSRGYFRTFYARRTLRIFPLYYLALAAVFVALPPICADRPEAVLRVEQEQGWLWGYASNFLIALRGWVFDNPWYQLNHFWSLAVEEQFYLVWPAIVLLAGRRTLMVICGLCVAGAFALRIHFIWTGHPGAAYVLTPCRMDSLAVGAWLAALAAEGRLAMLARPARCAFALLAPLAVLLLLWRSRENDPVIRTMLFSMLAPLFAALMVMVLTARRYGRIERVFTGRTLQFLGRYSYGLYVFHFLLIPVFVRLAPIPALAERFGAVWTALLAYIVIAGLGSVGVALLSWHLFEARFLRLKRFFEPAGARPAITAPASVPEPVLPTARAPAAALAPAIHYGRKARPQPRSLNVLVGRHARRAPSGAARPGP